MSHLILIVEDDTTIANWLRVFLEEEGFTVEVAKDGRTGLNLARSLAPDLIVLDLMLPLLDGMELCQILRRESDVPIIMLTARAGLADRTRGLDTGADDYVVKPFDPEEVVARAKAVLRRVHDKVQQRLSHGRITIDETTRRVTVDEKPVNLSRTLYLLLATFMRHPNQVLTRDQLIALAFDDDFDAYDRSIDNYIFRLRKQIAADGFQPIQTVYGSGYRLVTKDE
ncbi:MAG: response regulator transcription factor [Caldilineaceae bacterium]|nr:response regulator transcription factor [Caldilineaceae bacterium]